MTVLRTEDGQWIHYYGTTEAQLLSVSVNDKTQEPELQKILGSIWEDPDGLPGD